MEILIKRIAKKETYTIGKLYIDGKYYCDTIEDKDRGLTQSMSSKEIADKKIKHKTAIPTGKYELTLKVKSPKYSQKKAFVDYCNAFMPRFVNIPGYEGVLIHTGNTAEDSSGCIVVGYNKVVGKVINSMNAFKTIYPVMKTASDKGEKITVTIE